MTDREMLIREAVAAEAAQAVDARTVMAELHRRKARRRPFALIAVAGLTVAAAAVAVVVPLTASRDHATTDPGAVAPVAPRNVLLVGLDEDAHADSVALARVTAQGIGVVSLPRDSWVDVPGAGKQKLNVAYTRAHDAATGEGRDGVAAGADVLARTVEALTGAEVDHYAVVGMASFGRVADAVGGVEVCLNAATRDPFAGADFPAGRQVLGGEQALAFVRQRRHLPNGDLDRVLRQQAFLRAAVAKVLDPAVLDDPGKIVALVEAVRSEVRTDEGWDLLGFARGLAPAVPVRSATIPVVGTAETPAGAALEVDPVAVREFVTAFAAEQIPGGTGTPAGNACVN